MEESIITKLKTEYLEQPSRHPERQISPNGVILPRQFLA